MPAPLLLLAVPLADAIALANLQTPQVVQTAPPRDQSAQPSQATFRSRLSARQPVVSKGDKSAADQEQVSATPMQAPVQKEIGTSPIYLGVRPGVYSSSSAYRPPWMQPQDDARSLLHSMVSGNYRYWIGELRWSLLFRRSEWGEAWDGTQQSQQDASAWLGSRSWRTWNATLEGSTGLDAFMRRSLGGLDVGPGGKVGSSRALGSQWRLSTAFQHRPKYFDDREIGGGIVFLRSAATGVEASLFTSPNKPVTTTFSGQAQRVTDGYNLSGEGTLAVHPTRRSGVSLVSQIFFTAGEPRYVGRGEQYNQFQFAELTARSVSTTLRATYWAHPRLYLQADAQVLFASGEYHNPFQLESDNVNISRKIDLASLSRASLLQSPRPGFSSTGLNFNVVLRWNPTAHTGFTIIYTHSQSQNPLLLPLPPADLNADSLRRTPAADVLFFKLVHEWS